jgi:hypothetical protein
MGVILRAVGGITGAALGEPSAPVPRPLFRLFYQVEIRRRQLHSMISHSFRAVNVQCDYGNCVVVDTASPGQRVWRQLV